MERIQIRNGGKGQKKKKLLKFQLSNSYFLYHINRFMWKSEKKKRKKEEEEEDIKSKNFEFFHINHFLLQ
jgi:hypothetical protein